MHFEDVLEGAEVHNPEVDGMQERVDAALKHIEWNPDIKSEEESFEELDKWWNEKLGMNLKTREKLADTLFESGQEPRNIILSAVYLGYKLAEASVETELETETKLVYALEKRLAERRLEIDKFKMENPRWFH